jgi:hypothetical protein
VVGTFNHLHEKLKYYDDLVPTVFTQRVTLEEENQVHFHMHLDKTESRGKALGGTPRGEPNFLGHKMVHRMSTVGMGRARFLTMTQMAQQKSMNEKTESVNKKFEVVGEMTEYEDSLMLEDCIYLNMKRERSLNFLED